ncbi:N-acetylglucosaminyldiphosphoundecaprenol N-acetyl-beta-D-mannosaminyltransferase [Alkalibacillus flavidus]|uniref:N-acetylglucosaminyldiphosphoundecaprenol N-acetyl-beta-D-mannosaminyltransferase n=1 Tax=Alkalibacillus flavidus TaxID=546021 RepID=A0ABV2KXA9_9BACI
MQYDTYLGVRVSPLTYDDILNQVNEMIATNDQATIFAVNPEKIMTARQDDELRHLLNNATFQIPDGVGVLLASKLYNGRVKERVTGVDLSERLLGLANDKGYRVFFYGAKEAVGQKMQARLQERFPNLTIAGYQNGYDDDPDALVDRINESGADMLFVALGSPKQERWINDYRERLNVSVIQGVGGTFDVLAGEVKRAPKITQKLGIEWLYRLLSDPKRWRRQIALPKFLLTLLFNRKQSK